MLKQFAVLLCAMTLISLNAGEQAGKAAQAKSNKQPAPAVAPVKPSETPSPQPESKQHVDADIKVVALPSKDWEDVAAFAISVILALVGIAGIGVGICTLIYLRRQAGEMRLQRKVMVRTLRGINRQAELMVRQANAMDQQNKAVRDRERARISVKFPPGTPDFDSPWRIDGFDEPELMMNLCLEIFNEGTSKAFDVRAVGMFQFQEKESKFVAKEPLLPINVPDVIRFEDIDTPIPMVIETLITARDVDALKDAKLDFYVFGEVTYVDVFGYRRKTPFRFMWEVEEYEDVGGQPCQYEHWTNDSPQSA
jgi:hypothetical protein